MKSIAVFPADNTTSARRLRDARFDSFGLALVAAEAAAMETAQSVSIEEHDGERTTRTWTVRHDAPSPTEADVD